MDGSLSLGLLDHGQPDPVLDRAQRIEEFQLQREVGHQPVLGRDPGQPHQRRGADHFQDAAINPPAGVRIVPAGRAGRTAKFGCRVSALRASYHNSR